MKVCKPLKVPVLTRIFPIRRVPRLHVSTFLAFPLASPRALLDEIAVWPKLAEILGPVAIDEGLSKACGEFLVAGSCVIADARPVSETNVRVRVGQVERTLAVVGERRWSGGAATRPVPFVERQLDWSQAFGGAEVAGNPYGRGIAPVSVAGTTAVPLPTVERLDARISSPNERPEPASLLPMDFTFAARRALAGTFDENYVRDHAPGLPDDHHPSVFNTAQPEQRTRGLWRGDERFLVDNMCRDKSRLEGSLPGLVTRTFVEQTTSDGPRFIEVPLGIDTVWLFPTAGLGLVVAHGSTTIADRDARDVTALVAACETLDATRPLEHYRAALERRRDKDRGALYDLSDSDLMPPPESGVVANIDLGTMGQWTKQDGHLRQRTHNGAVRRRQRAREHLLADGKDPAAFGLADDLAPLEPLPDPGDFDATVSRMEANAERLKRTESEAAERKERWAADSAAELAKVGKTSPLDEATEETGGPPKYRAKAHLEQLAARAAAARGAGAPQLDLEAQLANPTFRERLSELERRARAGYLTGAHYGTPAPPMTSESSQMARVVVELAREANESLAERDFTGASLAGMDLRELDLCGAMLEGADLRGADLSGANLEGAVLARADLSKAVLRGTKLARANLGRANLTDADLGGALMPEAILTEATTRGASFREANLCGAEVSRMSWEGVDLAGASFVRTTFMRANLSGANLSGANLEAATLLECTLDGTRLDRARLERVNVVSCRGTKVSFMEVRGRESVFAHANELTDADFRRADLERSCLRTTVFRGSRFEEARMNMADLSECDARDSVFDRADLRNAMLIRCQLKDASFRGANLLEASLTGAQVAGAAFTGAHLVRADLMGAAGDERTTYRDAVTTRARFDASRPEARR